MRVRLTSIYVAIVMIIAFLGLQILGAMEEESAQMIEAPH